jgi:integrase
VLVCPQTKEGSPLRVAVSVRVLKAGERLLERGEFSRKNFALAVKAACRAAKIAVFTPGRLRHSIATHAINSGADMAAVASFLNHKSPRTTARYYATSRFRSPREVGRKAYSSAHRPKRDPRCGLQSRRRAPQQIA